jgi:hypothetical protein
MDSMEFFLLQNVYYEQPHGANLYDPFDYKFEDLAFDCENIEKITTINI